MDIIRLYIGPVDYGKYWMLAIALLGISAELTKRRNWRIAFYWKDRLIKDW